MDETEFIWGVQQVAQDLAKQIAHDGEGATKLLTVAVTGAESDAEARRAARAVVLSPLVKSAAHGNDPNWGRILSSVGATGVGLGLPPRISGFKAARCITGRRNPSTRLKCLAR